MTSVLITGAKGFIGSSLIKLFTSKKYKVIGWDVDIKETKFKDNDNLKEVDLGNQNLISRELIKDKPDIIIHCAGSADVSKSVRNPDIDFQGNVALTHNLLFGIYKSGITLPKIVFLSSAAVYGNPKKLPITEKAPVNPLSPYALHKVMCEQMCQYFISNYQMNIKILRIFSAYGTGLKKQIFWDMYNKAKLTGRLDMFGSGNESRDFINITDVIESIYLVATKDTADYDIYNVANGSEVSIRDAATLFANIMRVPSEKVYFNNVVREGDPLNWQADISRLKNLGYKPSVSMENGLVDYFKWIEGNSIY